MSHPPNRPPGYFNDPNRPSCSRSMSFDERPSCSYGPQGSGQPYGPSPPGWSISRPPEYGSQAQGSQMSQGYGSQGSQQSIQSHEPPWSQGQQNPQRHGHQGASGVQGQQDPQRLRAQGPNLQRSLSHTLQRLADNQRPGPSGSQFAAIPQIRQPEQIMSPGHPRLLRPGTISLPERLITPSPADQCSSSADLNSLIPRLNNPLTPSGYPGAGFMAGQQHYDYHQNSIPTMPTKRPGGRRPKEFDMIPEMEDEDYDKRMKRRQRNKEAAARCRQRRLELMQTLQEQVDKHKEENRQKEMQMREMRGQIEHLQRFMQSHDCKLSPEERQAHLSILPQTHNHNETRQLQNIPPHTQAPPTSHSISGMNSGALHPSQAHLNPPNKDQKENVKASVMSFERQANNSVQNNERKRPLPHADETFGSIALKQPKTEVTLSQLNSSSDGLDLERPSDLSLPPSSTQSSSVLVTPSHGLSSTPYQPAVSSFLPSFSMMTPGPGSDLLNGPTGITPIANHPVTTVFPTTSDSQMPMGSSDLRNL